VIEQIIAENRTVYGVNTGFGKLSDVRIDPSQIRALQLNLVRSHSCGLGDPLSIEEARAMLLLRANRFGSRLQWLSSHRCRDFDRDVESRRHTGGSLKRFGRCERRSGAAGASGAHRDW
jgi:hypothetical protein